jgi:hypothetical protein
MTHVSTGHRFIDFFSPPPGSPPREVGWRVITARDFRGDGAASASIAVRRAEVGLCNAPNPGVLNTGRPAFFAAVVVVVVVAYDLSPAVLATTVSPCVKSHTDRFFFSSPYPYTPDTGVAIRSASAMRGTSSPSAAAPSGSFATRLNVNGVGFGRRDDSGRANAAGVSGSVAASFPAACVGEAIGQSNVLPVKR